jgi:hypothetical protein
MTVNSQFHHTPKMVGAADPRSVAADPALLAQVEEEGFCLLPGLLDPDEVAVARAAAVATSEQAASSGYPTVIEALDPGGRNVRCPDLPAYDPVFADLVMHPAVLPYVGALLTDDWVISNFSGNNALPGSGSMNAHSDQSTIMPEPWPEMTCLNVIWCLDDVDEGNGATRYLPGSHEYTRFSDVPADPKAGMRAFEAEAGSAIVMHGRMWHTSGANTSADRERMMLFAFYARGYLRLQANWWQLLPPAVSNGFTPELQDRLGLLRPNRGYGAYIMSDAPQPKLGS